MVRELLRLITTLLFEGPVFESQQIGTKVVLSEHPVNVVDFSKYVYQLFRFV